MQSQPKYLRILYKTLSIFMCIAWSAVAIFFGYVFFLKKYVYRIEYREEIIRESQLNGIDALLVFSIVKNESNFDKKAVSKKGAVGLMQLTPSTAEYIAMLKNFENYDLTHPEDNLRLGVAYLNYLMNKFPADKTAVAAYNAGEGNVSLWLQNEKYSDDKITLKTIPFSETEKYVDKIFKTLEKYRKLYRFLLDK